jgi:hypothetical protein
MTGTNIWPLRSEDIRLLAEVGFLASARGDLQAAGPIFALLEQCRPALAAPYVGMALAQLHRNLHDEAVRTLDRGLPHVAAEDVAAMQAIRALALRLGGRASECDRALKAAGPHARVFEPTATAYSAA